MNSPRPPSPAPLRSGYLAVGDGHRLYYETWGNPHGLPVLVLHGGPGSGTTPRLRSLYDESLCHLVLFDQRGAGRSQPAGELRANDTAALLADIERLRTHLGLTRWLVTGGSWGASLALAYAASHRQAVLGLLLRSVFLTGAVEVREFFQGAARWAPEAWATLAGRFSTMERDDLLAALQRQLEGDDAVAARQAAMAWAAYEQSLAMGGVAVPAECGPDDPAAQDRLRAKYRLQAHYLRQECFLGEARLLDLAATLAGMPVALLHGRRDRICRPRNACLVQQRIPGSQLYWIAGCGHDPFHPAMAAVWLACLRQFAAAGLFPLR